MARYRRVGPALILACLISAASAAAARAENWRPAGWRPAPGLTQIRLWPGPAPDAPPRPAPEETSGKPGDSVVRDVSDPTLTVYAPRGRNTGAAVVVFPGGGFQVLAMDIEGTEICGWLTSRGVTCVLLKYRVPNTGPHWDDGCQCQLEPKAPMALQDAQRALGLVRFHAADWHIDPRKVGVIGFSAGGYLVAWISTHFQTRAYAPVDELR
jgi:acetyl esterase/lipase